MGRRLTGLIVLLFVLFPCTALPAEEASESTYLIETQGTPYPQEERVPAPTGEAMILDLLIGRPLGVAALVLGTGMSILATPFTLASGTTGPVYGKLVGEPYNFLVSRPLGAFPVMP